MRVNSRVFTERVDMLGNIEIPNCPSQFKVVAERLLIMATKLGYSVTDYNNVTQLDKIIMVDYWREYDGLNNVITKYSDSFGEDVLGDFDGWFVKEATTPDLITRALRWLVSHNYIILKPEVQARALEASNKWRQAVSQD